MGKHFKEYKHFSKESKSVTICYFILFFLYVKTKHSTSKREREAAAEALTLQAKVALNFKQKVFHPDPFRVHPTVESSLFAQFQIVI